VTRTIVVTAAVVCRDGCYLVTRRQQGVHLEGFWEFPGGKCDGGEPLDVCLARELREELDVEARVGAEIHAVTHRYDDRDVELHFFECELTRDARPAAAARSGHALGAARGSANAPHDETPIGACLSAADRAGEMPISLCASYPGNFSYCGHRMVATA
jgi:mutator protein MutT